MSIELLFVRYGVIAILLGAGLEGEATVVAGGILAHRHLIPLWEAVAAASAGSFIIDQAWFFLGRHCQHYAWVQKAMRRPTFERATALLERHPRAFIFGFRFAYGLRMISPIAIGASHVPVRTFVPLNACAALLWGTAFTLIGYVFGQAFSGLFREIGHAALYAVAIVLGVALALGIVARVSHRTLASLWRRPK
ncbi:DedA family protein [Novosphingobium aquimarinum]|jgi:membrane protein DedA with SNARE-associated domain|uniref:DedA family protein n=1 Tax=Novosphingobium aquimarinum TaxID=2682494 RepID=UPI0012EC649A|nr:DedA family protein [Novosphingobium aquimarinum]|tara:strand:- start:1267 stop:1848 length:582 start_codon:yes stop_codon:yes gene_type:complete